ncbi:hypothetical protein [Nostoc sp. TCL240-02]|uniref:hypothetical protein n=1 Tax=Nostoc sp. TCL240-02 TaxID=2572090 RepID=UPI00157FB061|nr:hypothetical protein [Nostoc sp. TCL240-02]QKQ76351.1 hypothetical protein FBB35_26440 [Nostoc sp. TCL240-02]QKQ76459.1 hypothetical protein FBB35_27025 [Nostoc sp. TCL240-02]
MSNEVIMWIVGLSVPAFVSLLVLFVQERGIHRRQRMADYASKERVMVLLENDISNLKSTTDKMSVVLDRVDVRLDTLSERMVKVETKLQ